LSRFYSEAGQDLFALTISDFKENGTYLEVGAGHSRTMSNTLLLEKDYGWKGLSIEKYEKRVYEFNSNRSNECIKADALTLNYQELLDSKGFPKEIDYLSLDIEPAPQTLQALKMLLATDYIFKAVTFEHDLYVMKANDAVKKESHALFLSAGYSLYRENVCINNNPKRVFEDWWVYI
jgi:hypothetical protein